MGGDLAQHIGPVWIGEPHVLEADVQRARSQILGLLWFLQLNRRIERLDDTTQPRGGALGEVEDLDEVLDRLDEQVDEEEERQQRACRDALVGSHEEPGGEHHRGERRAEHLRGREENIGEASRSVLDVETSLHRVVDAVHRVRFGAVSTNHRQRGDGLPHDRHAVGHALPYDVVAAAEHPLEVDQADGVQHDPDQDQQREPPLVDGHRHDRDERLGAVDEEHHAAPLHEVLERPDVGRDA